MPRLLLAIPAVLVCIGCGSSPRPFEHEVDCIHIESEVALDTDVLAGNIELAKSLLTPIVGDFCALLQGTPIVVLAEPWAKDIRGEYVVAQNTIYLIPRFGAFVHEALHVWDARHLVFNFAHTDWETNGYQVSVDFENASANPFGSKSR